MKRAAASTKSAARSADAGRTLSREQLVEGYGLPLSRFGVFEALGIIASEGDDGFRCDDDDRLIIAAAAVQLGFDERELGELMELYDNTTPQDRALSRFMKKEEKEKLKKKKKEKEKRQKKKRKKEEK